MANGTKAPKGWLIAALVCLLLGIAGCGLGAVSTASFVSDVGDAIVAPTPYGQTMTFTGTGDDALVMASDGSATCDVTDEDGRSLSLDSLESGTTVETEGLSDVGTFPSVDGRTYEVVCDGFTGGEFTVISIDLGAILVGAGGLLGGGFFLFLAVLFLIIGLVRRSGWKKKQRLGNGPGGPGGYPPPGPGYGGPPAPGAPPQQGGWGAPPGPQPTPPQQDGWGAPPGPQPTPPQPGGQGAPPAPGQGAPPAPGHTPPPAPGQTPPPPGSV